MHHLTTSQLIGRTLLWIIGFAFFVWLGLSYDEFAARPHWTCVKVTNGTACGPDVGSNY